MIGKGSQIEHAPLISVLMPCYNHEAYVISSLESVASSDYKSVEFIFIDDASNDNSFSLATKWFENNKDRFVRSVCIRHEKNRGICATLNELYAHSRGEYINILASDDNLLPDGLSKQVDFAIRSGVDFVLSDIRLIDESGNLITNSALQFFGKNGKILVKNKACLMVDIMYAWDAPWNKSFMSKALVNKIGSFDETLSYEDRDFAIRAVVNGSFALLLDQTTAYRIRLKSRLTPGLKLEVIWRDFRKADCKNYLRSSGLTRLLLGVVVYSYEEKFRELGIKNAIFIWLATRTVGTFKRLITIMHRTLMRLCLFM